MATTLVIKNADFSTNKLDTVSFDGDVPCTGIELSSSTIDLTEIGSTSTLTATLTPAGTTDNVSWSSSNNSVASVSNGVVTAVSLGDAVITATCGTQSASCLVSVTVIPSYSVVGATNPYRTGSSTNGAFVNVVDTSGNGTKYGAIGYVTDDTNVRTIDRGGAVSGDFRLCPIPIPNGAKRIKIESNLYSSNTRITFKPRFTWFDSTKKAGNDYVGAKVLAGLGSDSNWDESTLASSVTVNIPTTEGIDSFACAINVSDWVLAYNTDYSQYFDVTILPEASA